MKISTLLVPNDKDPDGLDLDPDVLEAHQENKILFF